MAAAENISKKSGCLTPPIAFSLCFRIFPLSQAKASTLQAGGFAYAGKALYVSRARI